MARTIEGIVFNFPEAEAIHMKIAANEYLDAFQLFRDILLVTNDGFSLVGALPRFELRDPRTLSAALFTRSLKSLSCALNAVFHGYYGVAFTLTRSVYENILIHTEIQTNKKSAAALFENDQRWWKGSKGQKGRSFREIADSIDRRLVQDGKKPIAIELYDHVYGPLSTYAHPRTQGTRIEFNKSGDHLITSPEWEAEYCLAALIIGIDTARFNLLQFAFFVSERDEEYLARADGIMRRAIAWLEANQIHR